MKLAGLGMFLEMGYNENRMELETTMDVGSLLLWSLGGLGLSLAGGVGVYLGWAAWWVVLGGILGSRFYVLGPFVLYVVVWHV